MKKSRLVSAFLLFASVLSIWLLIAGVPRYRLWSAPPLTPTPKAAAAEDVLRFAVIGDYGMGNQAESDVAGLVKSWNPAFVITLGDNNYPSGAAATIDEHIGKDYASFIFPYTGAFGPGGTENRFFPALGNHDWLSLSCTGQSCTGPYLDYFTLPGNERYYDFVRGPVHFFVIDSDPNEPDGRNAESVQARWLKEGLEHSSATWKIVSMHHTIYSSSLHGSEPVLQWPYQQWGAHLVLTGHDHTYERVMLDGFPYIVNGMGGAGIRTFGQPVPGSLVRYNGDYGAQLVEATATEIRLQFINLSGQVIDDLALDIADQPTPAPTPQATVVVIPDADAYVSADSPDSNFGADLLLEIDGSPQKLAYLRFDLGSLTGATLRSAYLRLRVADVGGAESTSTQSIRLSQGSDWEEQTIVFQNRPALADGVLGTVAGGTQGVWIDVPLGEALQFLLGETATLAVESEGSDGLDVSAREGSHPPQLVLAYDRATPTPAPTREATPTALPTGTPTRTPTPNPTRPPEETPTTNVYLPRVNR
ncbi:MAG: DNRLRE domain-containing protein [Caldilineaceae bacterium]|nr:DNRLRE domain-containing protein [Caldilineaceae bacterium]